MLILIDSFSRSDTEEGMPVAAMSRYFVYFFAFAFFPFTYTSIFLRCKSN